MGMSDRFLKRSGFSQSNRQMGQFEVFQEVYRKVSTKNTDDHLSLASKLMQGNCIFDGKGDNLELFM